MSIALMNAVWKSDLPSTQKFVALSLADQANDTGECYPSLPIIAARCSLSDRAVRSAIRELELAGVLQTEHRNGRSAVYQFRDPTEWCRANAGIPSASLPRTPERGSAHPGTSFRPEGRSARNDVPPTPEAGSAPPRNDVPPTPERRSAITTNESPVEPPMKRKRADAPVDSLDVSSWPERPSDQVLADWLAMRRKRRAPVSDTVVRSMARELTKAKAMGFTVDDCLEKALNRNWQGFEAEWMAPRQQGAATQTHAPPEPPRRRELGR